MQLDLTGLQKGVTSLNRALEVADPDVLERYDPAIGEVMKAGVIQNFEFTYELCWKFIRRWLKENYSPEITDGVSRRELFRMAAENLLIEDVDRWMSYHDARNRSSHTYQPEIAEEVFRTAFDFARDAARLYQVLEERND